MAEQTTPAGALSRGERKELNGLYLYRRRGGKKKGDGVQAARQNQARRDQQIRKGRK